MTAPGGAVTAAQAADQAYIRQPLSRRPESFAGWHRVPDEQVARLLAGAMPYLHCASCDGHACEVPGS